MIVCHCKGTTDRQVRACVRNGAASVGAVSRACGAASSCGGCARAVREIVRAEQASGVQAGRSHVSLPLAAAALVAG